MQIDEKRKPDSTVTQWVVMFKETGSHSTPEQLRRIMVRELKNYGFEISDLLVLSGGPKDDGE